MMERMESMEILLPRIMPQVMHCPKSMIMDTLRMLAVDFCKESGVWDAVFRESICPCETVIPLALPKGAAIAKITELWLDDEKLGGKSFEAGQREIILHEPRQTQSLATVKASLRPLRMASDLPGRIIEEWGDILAFGATGKIKAMSGNHVDWSDPQGASTYYQLYQEGITKARSERFRKRLGSGVLYVNTGEDSHG